jgi:hypothetical protein
MIHLQMTLPVKEVDGSDHFRSYLKYYLKENKSFLYGTVDRISDVEVKINAYWLASDQSRILECFCAALPSVDSFPNTVIDYTEIVNVTRLPPLWLYESTELSPQFLVWDDSFVTTDDGPLIGVPAHQTPSDTESQNTQTAHIVSRNDGSTVGAWLIAQAPGETDSTALEWYRKFDNLTLTMPFDDHTNYDRLHFFFAWRAIKIGTNFSITLSPVIVKDGKNCPLPHYTLEEILPNDLDIYLHSLVLRKYLTLIIRRKLNCLTAFKCQWQDPPHSDNY